MVGIASVGAFAFTQKDIIVPNTSSMPEEIKIGLYPGVTYRFERHDYTESAVKFEIVIKNFSTELQLATLSGEAIGSSPYNLQPIIWDREAQYAYWGFKIIAPESILPGVYEINLTKRVSGWLSSKGYPLRIKVIVDPLKESSK